MKTGIVVSNASSDYTPAAPQAPHPVRPSRIIRDWPAVLALLAGGVLLAPLLALVVMAVLTFEFETLRHLARTVLADAAVTSALLALGAVGGAILLGAGAAWCIERHRFAGRDLLAWMLVLPLAMPTYVIAYAYTDLLQFSGPIQGWMRHALGWTGRLPDIRSLGGAIALFALVLYPYVYLLVRTALADVPTAVIESARALGQSRRRVLWRIVLPLVLPALSAGAMLVLMETLADVGATYYFGLITFSAGIYNAWFALGDRGAALLLAVALLVVILVAFLIERWARGSGRRHGSGQHRPWPPQTLRGWPAVGMVLLLSIPVLGGFILPVAGLLWRLTQESGAWADLTPFWGWVGHSATLGTLGATVTLLLALLFAWACRLSQRIAPRWPILTAATLRFGYAVPGAVVALAILWPVAAADNALADALNARSLFLTGTMGALLYAYALRFFAVAWGGIDSALQRIPPNLDQAAATLGSTRLRIFGRVHLPLMMRPILVGWVLVLIDIMKELPATLMLRPFNYDTLAVITQHLAQDERLAETALPALAIVLVGLIPLVLLSRLLGRAAH